MQKFLSWPLSAATLTRVLLAARVFPYWSTLVPERKRLQFFRQCDSEIGERYKILKHATHSPIASRQ